MLCLISTLTFFTLTLGNTLAGFNGVKLGYPPPFLGDTALGSVWPQPQDFKSYPQTFPIAIEEFSFEYTNSSFRCFLLDEAFKRYEMLLMDSAAHLKLKFNPNAISTIKSLQINLSKKCENQPHSGMDEYYILSVEETALLDAASVWGILRGLETFSQLIWENNDNQLVANHSLIIDYPRFSHRGILLDTSRHFLPVDILLNNLDAMAYNKFNVFHWHIVDDQSFPYTSKAFPALSNKGSFNPLTHIYTQDDVAEIIEYARLRGIRVVPEFDTPGHTQSWGKGQPGLLTPCYKDTQPNGLFGPINPILNSSYSFISQLFTELRQVFPDEYIHLGGDEVSFVCWKSNPDITEWMAKNNISGNYPELEQVYIQRVIDISGRIGFKEIVWQEVVDNGVKISKDSVVHVWKNNPKPQVEMAKITALGYRALISSPWYLNRISTGYYLDWVNFYAYEPSAFNGTNAQKDLVAGGEACMWGEFVDSTNLIPRLWPRASAVGERLWSAKSVNNTDIARPRLHQHRCRLIGRGIAAEPLHPGYCKHDWRNY